MSKRASKKAANRPGKPATNESGGLRVPTLGPREKLDVLRALAVLHDAATRAASRARRDGLTEEHEILALWQRKLEEAIGDLRVAILREWRGLAADLTADIERRSREIEAGIESLRDAERRAEKVIEIAGMIDEVVDAARGLLV